MKKVDEIRPQFGAQTRFLSSNADFAIYGGSAGSGKALNIHTPILTPTGFKPIGELQSGDQVFNEYFEPCAVIEAHDIFVPNECYRLTFSHGDKIECCGDHLWQLNLLDDQGRVIKTLVRNTSNLVSLIWCQRYAIRRHAYSQDHIKITDYEVISPRPMRCITVDNPSHLYLCGESMIPTHNSYSLLLEAARNINNPGYGAVIFRREMKMITSEGGLRDTALEIYPHLGGIYRSQPTPQFIFPSGAKISFAHLNQESEVLSWQGSQIPFIGYDELTHFTRFQMTYMMSRMRSTCGVVPYCRATTNPDSDSWVAELLSWWIDQETGFPIPERSGVLRYFIRSNDEMAWADSREELVEMYGCEWNDPKSMTFISAKITDNPILLKKDPAYLGNLKALSRVERARLLDGNWKIRASAGMYFPREDAKIIDWKPDEKEIVKWVRAWDLAASEESEGRDPDWTVGLLVGRCANGKLVIADMVRVRRKAAEVRSLVRTMAMKDGHEVWISLARDPGQAGKEQAESYLAMLRGFTVIARTITRSKTIMAEPAAALWQQGNIQVVRAAWNEDLLSEFEAFPEGKHDDIVDCIAAAARALPGHARPDYSQTGLSGRFKPIVAKPRKRNEPLP